MKKHLFLMALNPNKLECERKNKNILFNEVGFENLIDFVKGRDLLTELG
jgi:hypothetical protein